MTWGFISELPITPDEYDALDAELPDDPPVRGGLTSLPADRPSLPLDLKAVCARVECADRIAVRSLRP